MHANSEHHTGQPDPTRMAQQPALRSSSGTIWLVMAACFLVASLVPLTALAFFRQGPSSSLALIIGLGAIGLYAAMVLTRVSTQPGALRLKIMAGCMLGMAALTLFGTLGCLWLEQAAAMSAAAPIGPVAADLASPGSNPSAEAATSTLTKAPTSSSINSRVLLVAPAITSSSANH